MNDIEISVEMFESEIDVINLASEKAECVEKLYIYKYIYMFHRRFGGISLRKNKSLRLNRDSTALLTEIALV